MVAVSYYQMWAIREFVIFLDTIDFEFFGFLPFLYAHFYSDVRAKSKWFVDSYEVSSHSNKVGNRFFYLQNILWFRDHFR